MVKIVIADAIHPDAHQILENAGFQVVDINSNKTELDVQIQEADGLIVRSATKVTKELLDIAPKLKIIGRAGVGTDNIDKDECEKREISVVNSPEGPTRSVAELTLALLISSARKLTIANNGTKDGNWPKKNKGIEIFGKTLGIIGSGAIGGLFAKYCIALGMKVVAYDIVELEELKTLDHFSYKTLDDVLKEADFISLHVPLLPSTKHIINKDTIQKMKDGVILINAARGGIIDETALLTALKSGKVAGVALDVFEKEPVDKSNELVQHPNVIATPHIGAQTYDASKNNTVIVCNKIIKYFE